MGGRIGYVDYDLENFHANKYLELLQGPMADRGFEVCACTGMIEEPSRAWAEKNGIPYCDAAGDMAGQVDYLMVLAPSDPEVHLELAQEALPLGKPTYIDKTFAPDLATAERIFALADEHGVPVITSSALRFADEVNAHVEKVGQENVLHMQAWGGGSSFGEYAIHPLEMVISAMGPEVTRVMRLGDGEKSQLDLLFSGGRTASVYVYTKTRCPFQATVTTQEETTHLPIQSGTYFDNLLAHILVFYAAAEETIDRRESLMIRQILDCAESAESRERFMAL